MGSLLSDLMINIELFPLYKGGWVGRAMVLGSFPCLGVLLLWHIHVLGQGPAVLAAGKGWVGFFVCVFSSRLSYFSFSKALYLG